MLAAKRSIGVTLEVNLLLQATKHTSEGIRPDFETQGTHHQKSKTGESVEKNLRPSKRF